MIRAGQKVFVDTSAWIALAIVPDPLHERAKETWAALLVRGAKLFTSVPVILETYTFLERMGSRDLALRWRRSLESVRMETLGCSSEDLARAWTWMERRDITRLGLVDATSFALMAAHHIRTAFAFDTHFAVAGFGFPG